MREWPGGGEPPELGDLGEAELAPLAEALAEQGGPTFPAREAAGEALDAVEQYAALVRRDARTLSPMRARSERRSSYWAQIPELPADVHDLEGLRRIGESIFGVQQGGITSARA